MARYRLGTAFPFFAMDILYVLVPLGTVVVIGALVAFRWALRTGQFDDLTTPPMRVVFDESDREAAK